MTASVGRRALATFCATLFITTMTYTASTIGVNKCFSMFRFFGSSLRWVGETFNLI